MSGRGRDAPIGGQAVLEGVMMRGVRTWSVAVRAPTDDQIERAQREVPEGEIAVSTFPFTSALRRHRVSPHDVELVINTHLHVDHCGNNCLFEHAAIAMSRREWDWTDRFYSTIFASSTPERAALEFYPELPAHNFKTRTIRNVARLARMFWRRDRLGAERRFVWLEETPLPPGLEILQTPGHTPYHVSILVNGSQPVLVAGDAVLHEDPGFSVRTMIPYSEELFLSTREQLLARRLPTIPGHGPLFEP